MERPPLIINMDETSIVRHVTGLVGTVADWPKHLPKPRETAALADRRCYISYVASVTHEEEVQRLLPQVLIGNEHQFTVRLLRDLADVLPAEIHVWRRKSAWATHETVRKYISLLAKSLGNLVHDRYVVLLMDVARSHIDQSIFNHARRCGVRLCYIPAGMTAELQPCDTHVFARFKHGFREMWRRQKAQSRCGVVTTLQWIRVIARAITNVLLENPWQSAFQATGILDGQSLMSQQLLRKLGWGQIPHDLARPPTALEAAEIFPRRLRLDVASYVHWQPKSHRAKSVSAERPPATSASAASSSAPMVPAPCARRVLPASFRLGETARKVRRLE